MDGPQTDPDGEVIALSIITNRELRDLWADAAKIKEAISGGKVAVADAAVLAKLEAMRVLLAGTLSTADAAVLAKLADLESKLDMILNGTTPAAVKLTGSNVQYLNVRDTTDGYSWVYGATKARSDNNFVPFSVTGYRRKAIYLKNNSTTKSITNIIIHLFQSVAQQRKDGAFASFNVSSVAAGASAVIEETQYPLLAVPVVGIAIELYVGTTLEPEGNFSVVLMGGA